MSDDHKKRLTNEKEAEEYFSGMGQETICIKIRMRSL
ncbi:hypothetical protein N643_07290 [Salmonella bongori serovar 48:z41:-- str. RKS3044]|nr:hypothetical protein N643_07290 [Salmonella bongori serovar 48:z41:-- str. RKS3044]